MFGREKSGMLYLLPYNGNHILLDNTILYFSAKYISL